MSYASKSRSCRAKFHPLSKHAPSVDFYCAEPDNIPDCEPALTQGVLPMKKRTWFKRSSLIISTAVSLAAPTGKPWLASDSKGAKPCKKSKSPLSSVADDSDADSRPPFGDGPPLLGPLDVGDEGTFEAVMQDGDTTASDLSSVDSCESTSVAPGMAATRPRRVRPPMEKRRPQVAQYAWKSDISTTVFWIGEQPTEENPMPNQSSSWDEKWALHYGGYDNPAPSERKGFLPAEFTPKQNPFYIALPYNDLAHDGHKDEAEEIIPWFKKEFTSKWKSVCKGRWIAIRKGDRVCYAQWEDAGPFTTNDADYVFGDARPKSNANDAAGLDVSPAVRDYLGLDGSDVTDWKFVEFEDVPLGPWAEHGENNDFVMNRRAADGHAVATRSSSHGKRSARSSS